MFSTLRRVLTWLACFLLVVFVLFVVNQTARAVELAESVHPHFGVIALWGLLALYAVLLFTPLYLYWRMPPPLVPPAVDEGPEFDRHLEALRKRLRQHPRCTSGSLDTQEEIQRALHTLDAEAEQEIRDTAAAVFLSTAVSQSGRLDALLVLSAHGRLVWRIAKTYYQRPSLRDMTFLYTNVAATAFVASEIEDIDISQQVQPVISSVLGGLAGAVPGLQAASTVLVHSVLTGSANAFLTLRVGLIAQQYCSSLVRRDRRTLRRSASARAAVLLGSIVSGGARDLVKAVGRASKKRLGSRWTNWFRGEKVLLETEEGSGDTLA